MRDSFIDASKAIDIEVDDLPRLSLLMSEESYREWRVKWQKAIDQIDRILQLPFDEFWSSLIYSPKSMNYIDSFLDVFPRRWEIDEMKLYVNTDAMVCTLSMSLFERVILVLLRAVTNNENSLCLSDEFYLRVIYDYKIFTIERLFNLINVYSKSNGQSVSIILQRTIGVQNKFMHDANNFVDICAKQIECVVDELNAIVRRRHVLSEGAASDGDERVLAVLSMMIGLFEAFRVIFPFFSPEIHRKCLSCLSVGIASFIDRLEDCISTDSAFANLVMSSSHPNLRCLLRLYDEVCAEASQLFHLLISSADNAKETSVIKLQEVLVYESFIFYYNLLYPISETLTKIFSSESDSQDMPLYLNDALNEISSKRTKVIIERLNSRGLMTQLGCPADDEVRSAMNEIGELLPHFSPQFIHLCLRHFGYDKEHTINALLDTSLLPLDLRALISVQLSSETAVSSRMNLFTLPIDSLNSDDDDEEEEDISTENHFESGPMTNDACSISDVHEGQLICMKPPDASQQNSAGNNSDVSSKIDAFGKYGPISKHSNHLQTVQENDVQTQLQQLSFMKNEEDMMLPEDQQVALAQALDEPCEALSVGKKHGGVEKFHVPESEKVALRPVYERYMYDKSSKTLWDNVYDDEYDDTFEVEQTFDIDKRDEDEQAVLEGVEPNRNRQIKVGKNEDELTEGSVAVSTDQPAGRPRYDERKRTNKFAWKNQKISGEKSEQSTNQVTTRRSNSRVESRNERDDNALRDTASASVTKESTISSQSDTRKNSQSAKKGHQNQRGSGGAAAAEGRQTYTGGRERQLKERHKGSDRRYRADRKMTSGMF